MNQQKKQQQQNNEIPHSLTLYVVFSIMVLLIYTVVEQFLSTYLQISHDTLTTCFYSVFGGEILCCALIKIFKLKGGGNNAKLEINLKDNDTDNDEVKG